MIPHSFFIYFFLPDPHGGHKACRRGELSGMEERREQEMRESEALPDEAGVDLNALLQQLTPEGKWFLKVLQHFNSKLSDRAEVRVYTPENSELTDCIGVTTYKSKLYLQYSDERSELEFQFERRLPTGESIGRWTLVMSRYNAKRLMDRVYYAVTNLPKSLSRIVEDVKDIDAVIREVKQEE